MSHILKNIPVETSPEGLKLIHNILKLSAKAHGNNPNPVELKQALAELPVGDILTTIEQVEDVLYNHNISFIKYQG